MITQYYDDGHRLYVELTIGRRWVHVLEAASLRKRRFPARDYAKNARNVVGNGKPYSYTVKPSKLAREINKRRKLYNKLGVNYSKAAVKDAIKILKGSVTMGNRV